MIEKLMFKLGYVKREKVLEERELFDEKFNLIKRKINGVIKQSKEPHRKRFIIYVQIFI